MSQENVEKNLYLLAAAIDALNARDTGAIDALFHDDVEWRPALSAGGAVEAAVYRGKDGMVRYLEEVDNEFSEVRFDVEGFDPVGDENVLYRGRLAARGSASGIPLDVPIWGLWQLRDGKLCRGQGFLSEKEALQAAGLSE